MQFRMTAKIAAANMAKRCQASLVSPAGIGENQMPNARAKDRACLSRLRNLAVGCVHWLCSPPAAAAAEPNRARPLRSTARPLTLPSSDSTTYSPLKGILPGDTGVTARPSQERPHDAVPGCHEFTFQFAVNLIATLVSPDTPALHAGEIVGEAYRPAPGIRLLAHDHR